MNNERLSLADAAKLLGVSRVTTWRWAKEGKLRAQKIGGRAYTTMADVESFRKEYVVDMAETEPKKLNLSPALS